MKINEVGKKNKQEYGGIIFDSKEEVYFSWYLQELEKAGLISKGWTEYHPRSRVLCEPAYYYWEEKLKTKTVIRKGLLLKGCSYTYDFNWLWDKKARGIFFENIDSKKKLTPPFRAHRDVSCVEIKGSYSRKGRNSNYRETKAKIKWLYHEKNIFVQVIVPEKLFRQTFTPERYLLTDKGGQKRSTITWDVKTLNEFMT
jgi:hypothetical protein